MTLKANTGTSGNKGLTRIEEGKEGKVDLAVTHELMMIKKCKCMGQKMDGVPSTAKR